MEHLVHFFIFANNVLKMVQFFILEKSVENFKLLLVGNFLCPNLRYHAEAKHYLSLHQIYHT